MHVKSKGERYCIVSLEMIIKAIGTSTMLRYSVIIPIRMNPLVRTFSKSYLLTILLKNKKKLRFGKDILFYRLRLVCSCEVVLVYKTIFPIEFNKLKRFLETSV